MQMRRQRKIGRAKKQISGQISDVMSQRQLPVILALGTTQTLAWASSMYLPAILADPMARDLNVS